MSFILRETRTTVREWACCLMSFFHKKNVTKFMGHHYAIWANGCNILLTQKKNFGPAFEALTTNKHSQILFAIFSRKLPHMFIQINIPEFFSPFFLEHFVKSPKL
jgi:hypothetical protein